MSTPQRKRNVLDFKREQETIDYAMNHPKSNQLHIAYHSSIFGELPVKRRTVGTYILNKGTMILRLNREIPTSDRS